MNNLDVEKNVECSSTLQQPLTYLDNFPDTLYDLKRMSIPKVDYLIKGLLRQNLVYQNDRKLVELNSDGGTGKTWLIVQLIVSVVSKNNFLNNENWTINLPENRNSGMIVTMEDSVSELKERFSAMIDVFIMKGLIKNEDRENIEKRIIIKANRAIMEVYNGKLINLIPLIKKYNPCIIDYDNYSQVAAMTDYDTNYLHGTQKILSPLTDIADMGVTSIINTHTTKNGGTQGNKTLNTICNLCLSLVGGKDKSRRLNITKTNDYIKDKKFNLEVESVRVNGYHFKEIPFFVYKGVVTRSDEIINQQAESKKPQLPKWYDLMKQITPLYQKYNGEEKFWNKIAIEITEFDFDANSNNLTQEQKNAIDDKGEYLRKYYSKYKEQYNSLLSTIDRYDNVSETENISEVVDENTTKTENVVYSNNSIKNVEFDTTTTTDNPTLDNTENNISVTTKNTDNVVTNITDINAIENVDIAEKNNHNQESANIVVEDKIYNNSNVTELQDNDRILIIHYTNIITGEEVQNVTATVSRTSYNNICFMIDKNYRRVYRQVEAYNFYTKSDGYDFECKKIKKIKKINL